MTVDILFAAKAIAAIAAAVVVVMKIIKPILELLKKVDKLEEHQRETYMQTLRLVITSEEMPLEERISAGDKYIQMGGNGAVKHLYQELLARLPDKP